MLFGARKPRDLWCGNGLWISGEAKKVEVLK
jgi:hypothetical protein